MALDKTLVEVFRVSKKERKSLPNQVIKLAEEHGELAAALLMSMGQKGTTMSKEEVRENVLEEACDVVLMALSIMKKAKFTEKEIDEMLIRKLKKWERRLGK